MKHKQRWMKKVFKLLCRSQGAPQNETHEKNLRRWAKIMAAEYFWRGVPPEDAHWEEMYYGS